MSDKTKNPFENDSPEYQLWENIKSSEMLVRSAMDDQERAAERAALSRRRVEKYQAALDILMAAKSIPCPGS